MVKDLGNVPKRDILPILKLTIPGLLRYHYSQILRNDSPFYAYNHNPSNSHSLSSNRFGFEHLKKGRFEILWLVFCWNQSPKLTEIYYFICWRWLGVFSSSRGAFWVKRPSCRYYSRRGGVSGLTFAPFNIQAIQGILPLRQPIGFGPGLAGTALDLCPSVPEGDSAYPA